MKIDLEVSIGGVEWKKPVTTAAGTFVKSEYYDPSLLGAVTTKGVSAVPWNGNPTPRIAETSSGMLNAVGLENKGVDDYINNELKELKKAGANVIANIVGHDISGYAEVAGKLNGTNVDMIEANISCPNISQGGIAFGTDGKLASDLVGRIREVTGKPLIVKLSPNVTDVASIAENVEAAGADAISMINTLTGMRIDAAGRKAVLANRTGGLSGPAVKPVALRMVYETVRRVSIPVIGMGGIMSGEDAAEFFMAGANAVAVGTAALIDPEAPVKILDELAEFMAENGYENIEDLREARHGL